MAQCWPQPIDEALAQLLQPQRPGPIWAILCPSPNEPPACTLPDAPTLTSVASDVAGTSLTQEWKLTATPPSNDQNPWSAATWIGEYDEPLEGWKSLWTIRTKDGFGGGTGQTSAELGATGMKPGRKHRFAVAYCRDAGASGVWGCTCRSSFTETPSTIDSSFPAFGPGRPANTPATPGGATDKVKQQIEDQFKRATTTENRPTNPSDPASPRGSELGPTNLWADSFPTVFATIDQPSEAARLHGDAIALYKAAESSHATSYAQVRFWSPAAFKTNYNLDLFVRWHYAPQLRAYSLKLVHNQLGASVPTIAILRSGEGDTDGDGSPDLIPPGVPTAQCPAPPFETATNPTRADGAWMQVLVEDFDDQGEIYPVIKGWVGWGCTGGGPDGTGFQNCTTVCTVTRPDVDDPDLMRGRVGAWGVWAHYHDHFVDSFEAGSLVP